MGFPDASTQAGKGFLDQYNAISHDIFILIWACFMAGCLVQYVRACTRDGVAPFGLLAAMRWVTRHVRRYPLVALLFLIYSIGLVATATWYYPEIIGWYADVDQGDLLNHFRFVPSFVGETMKRNDFRFFPLAHQDLHVLSWFTPYVKVWAMVNALEAIAVVILIVRFVRLILHASVPGLPLLVTLLLLLQSSFLESFYQFIFAERLLSLCFVAYAYSYLSWTKNRGKRYLYSALAAALLGVFLKEISLMLFVLPAALRAAYVLAMQGRQGWQRLRLERWIGWLLFGTVVAYGLLTALPSFYSGLDSYASRSSSFFTSGVRSWFLVGFVLVRSVLIFSRRCTPSLLDAFNAGALAYGIALYRFKGFSELCDPSGSHCDNYLVMPVLLVAAIDLAYLYGLVVLRFSAERRIAPRVWSGVVLAGCAGLAVLEQYQGSGVLQAAIPMAQRQESWRNAYAAMKQMAVQDRESGKPVNIIFSRQSWFNKRRHLHRLVFNRLIRFDPLSGVYDVMLGTGRGDRYNPKVGDYLLDIDGRLEVVKTVDSCWLFNQICYELVYQSGSGGKEGRVFRAVKDGANDAESNKPIRS